MLNLQKVLLIHLKKCVYYIIYELRLPRVSFKLLLGHRQLLDPGEALGGRAPPLIFSAKFNYFNIKIPLPDEASKNCTIGPPPILKSCESIQS